MKNKIRYYNKGITRLEYSDTLRRFYFNETTQRKEDYKILAILNSSDALDFKEFIQKKYQKSFNAPLPCFTTINLELDLFLVNRPILDEVKTLKKIPKHNVMVYKTEKAKR